MKAIILAAGMGKRMHPLTSNCPKCLLPLNGKTIIEHQISLLEYHNIDKIEIITGYESKKIEKNVKNKAQYFYYPDYNTTNNSNGNPTRKSRNPIGCPMGIPKDNT